MKNIFILLVLVSYGSGSAAQGTLKITSGTSIKTMKNAFIVLKNMNLVNNGTYVQDTGNGTTKITGHINATASGTGTTTLDEFELAANSGVTYTLAATVNIKKVLTLTSGQLAADGYLVLKSDSLYTARVAPVTSTASPVVSGNVTAERFVWGRRKYRLMCSSVTSSASATLSVGQEAMSIWGNWQNQGDNATANVGTIITGGTAGDGFDQQTQNASMYTYNDALRSFTGYTSANGKNTKYTPLKAGLPYYIFIYGDRTNTISASNPHNTVLNEAGTLLTGDQTYNTGSAIPISNITGRYSMMGNPFASPIDWATVTKTNIENTYWGWDPNLNNLGGFITVNTSGTVTLISPFTGTTVLNQYIQPGQGFFVKTSAASPVLTIREQDKTANYTGHVFKNNNLVNDLPLLAINLTYVNGPNTVLADGALAAFDSSFLNSTGSEDAVKMENAAETVSILNDTDTLSIDARKKPQHNDTLFLNTARLTRPQYSFQIFAQQMESDTVLAYLEDKYLNQYHQLSYADTNNIVFDVNMGIPASYDENRFRIIFVNPGTILPLRFISIHAAQKNSFVQVSWEVAEESGIEKYEIMKSADGIKFNKAGEIVVAAAGDHGYVNYKWLDENPFIGNNFYKVTANEADGYGFGMQSDIVFIKIDQARTDFKVSPNPVKDQQINIHAGEMEKGRYFIQLLNTQGQQVLQTNIDHSGVVFDQTIYIREKLPAGMYYLYIIHENKKFSQPVFVQ
jgi:hypothetical protein